MPTHRKTQWVVFLKTMVDCSRREFWSKKPKHRKFKYFKTSQRRKKQSQNLPKPPQKPPNQPPKPKNLPSWGAPEGVAPTHPKLNQALWDLQAHRRGGPRGFTVGFFERCPLNKRCFRTLGSFSSLFFRILMYFDWCFVCFWQEVVLF